MKIDLEVDTPDLFLEPSTPENYIIDRDPAGNGIATPLVLLDFPKPGRLSLEATPNPGLHYFYGVVAYKNGAPASALKITPTSLQQDPELITLRLQNGEDILAEFQDTIEISQGILCSGAVPAFAPEDLEFDDNALIIRREAIINMPNVWYDINRVYNYRDYFPINIFAVCSGERSLGVPLFPEGEQAYVPIHRIEILRRDITDTPGSTAPGTYDEPGSEICQQILLRGGVYDDGTLNHLQDNILSSARSISVCTEGLALRTLSLPNKVELGRTYKYTFRLFDCEKNSSEPATLIITT